eukprot:SAG11_NODE_5745_length_1473_cov_1.343523_1_plen_56_part_00
MMAGGGHAVHYIPMAAKGSKGPFFTVLTCAVAGGAVAAHRFSVVTDPISVGEPRL